MAKSRNDERGYNETCQMAFELISAWPIFHGAPAFAFPPPGIALIAALPDVKRMLTRNDSARFLCDALAAETKRRGLRDEPTAMMILVSLEEAKIPIERVALQQLLHPGQRPD